MAPAPTPFSRRHIGPNEAEAGDMAREMGCPDVDDLMEMENVREIVRIIAMKLAAKV